jgi:hypothetical protein
VSEKIHKPYRRKHGHTSVNGKSHRTPTYYSWSSMIARCTNPNARGFKNYGGAGVRVCERWSGKHGFANFLADLGARPEGTSLGRIGDTGHYEPGNCHFQTRRVQDVTRRLKTNAKASHQFLMSAYHNEQSLRRIAAKVGLSHSTVQGRLRAAGVKLRGAHERRYS